MAFSLIWEQTSTGEEEAMFATIPIAGELFLTGHTAIGSKPTKITMNIRKTHSATGLATLKLIDSVNAEKASFGSIDMDTLDDTFAPHDFTNLSNTALIADGDRIAFYYSNAGYFRFQMCSECSEANTHESLYQSGSWTNRDTLCTMAIYTSEGGSGTGGKLPPPPIEMII